MSRFSANSTINNSKTVEWFENRGNCYPGRYTYNWTQLRISKR